MNEGGKRLRVLLSAYACEPGRGSEPEVGWQVARHMARHCEVRVITRANNRGVIEEAMAGEDGYRPEFLYFDLPVIFLRLKRLPGGVLWYYFLWQIAVRFAFRGELRWADLVHHVTFNGVQFPGFWVATETPVLLGPLGGGMTCPPALLPLLGGWRHAERLRGVVIGLLPGLPWWKPAIANASVVLAANRETAALLQAHRDERVPVALETGISSEVISGPGGTRKREGRMKLLWLGNLLPRKAAVLAVRAVGRAIRDGAEVELWIAGEGSERRRVEALVVEMGLEGRVTLLGRIPKEEVPGLMDRADAFLFTSVRDTSGNVVLEAMSRGLPVIALNHQGVREICREETAVLVEVGGVEVTEAGLAAAICRLESSEELGNELAAKAAADLSQRLTWEHLSMRLLSTYEGITKSRKETDHETH